MSAFKLQLFASAMIGMLALAATPVAHANIIFSGSGSSGNLDGSSEPWEFNADGGASETGYLDNWGSPGVSEGTTDYSQADTAYGMVITFSGGGTINADSIALGNGSACVGTTSGGTTFCTIDPTDIWEAFLTGPNTIEFRAQNSTYFLSQDQHYFVNVFFDGAAPTSFTGMWLTEFAPNPVSVPEPGSIAIFGTGLFGLGLMLLLRRRQHG